MHPVAKLLTLSAMLVGITACTAIVAQPEGVGQTQAADSPDAKVMMTHVETHPSQGEARVVEDSEAILVTTENGAMFGMRTQDLQDGHVYTAWWAIINNPAACDSSPCSATDILGNTDAVQSEVTYGDGILVSQEGQMAFAGYLPKGETADGWLGPGLTNPQAAEFHIVINDHGLLIPDMAATMLNSYRGGCTDESLPPPFPATAIADGQPGPNTCALVQAAIFQQGE